MESVGFKEWAIVCDALRRGEQSILIRKGGVAEGREGFSFRHREFFLFPTWFHEQVEKVKVDVSIPKIDSATVSIDLFAAVESMSVVSEWRTAEALEALHILRPDVVRERFEYDEAPGLHVAFVRAFRLGTPWRFPIEKRFAGCRSWVDLPALPADLQLTSILTNEQHARKRAAFDAATRLLD